MNKKIVEITTPTCSVCKMIKPMVEKVVSGYDADFIVYDYEDKDAQKYLEQFRIKSVPAFFFVKDDVIVNTHFGAITLPDLKSKINSLYV